MTIALYQSRGDYPSLHIMVTDNPRYQEGKLCLQDKELALRKIEQWFDKHIAKGDV